MFTLDFIADDVEGNVRQAMALEEAGCEIIRVSVPSLKDVRLIEAIKNRISVPLVADIHFDYKVALECAAAGVDKIRINPGNIGGMDRVKAVADACRARNIPIRIGVNSGSLEKDILAEYGGPCAEALVKSAIGHARLLEQCDFNDIVISIKSSDVKTMIAAYRLAAEQTEYPLHLGVTEAGTAHMGLIKSAVGIGSLLCDGIGETIRVSLTDDPVTEVAAHFHSLPQCCEAVRLHQALWLRETNRSLQALTAPERLRLWNPYILHYQELLRYNAYFYRDLLRFEDFPHSLISP